MYFKKASQKPLSSLVVRCSMGEGDVGGGLKSASGFQYPLCLWLLSKTHEALPKIDNSFGWKEY